MLRSRIIPCLLVSNGGLVKTVGFDAPKYVGDPLNAVKIFNEKEVDELIVLDIDASVERREPDYDMIRHLARECRMPLCYGGGVKTVEQAVRIVSLGVEKVAISSAGIDSPKLIWEIAQEVGSQSVVLVMDVRKKRWSKKWEIWTHNGSRRTKVDPVDLAAQAQALGVGEVVVNDIDRDGTMEGYNFDLFDQIRDVVEVPLTILGGAGSLDDIGAAIDRYEIIGAAAGSLFVFKGVYRAVLISYPSLADKMNLMKKRPVGEAA